MVQVRLWLWILAEHKRPRVLKKEQEEEKEEKEQEGGGRGGGQKEKNLFFLGSTWSKVGKGVYFVWIFTCAYMCVLNFMIDIMNLCGITNVLACGAGVWSCSSTEILKNQLYSDLIQLIEQLTIEILYPSIIYECQLLAGRVCVCVRVCVYLYVYIYIYIYTHIHTCRHIYTWHKYIYAYLCVFICVLHMYIYICKCIYIDVCVNTYIYSIYLCIYIHI